MESPPPPPPSRQDGEVSISGFDHANVPSEFDFQSTYEAVKDKPLRVQKVLIKGLERTKPSIVSRELEPVQDAQCLDEIKDAMLEVHDALDSLDIFNAVEIIISDSGADDKEDTCTVLVNCEEKGRLRLHTGTYVVGTEGSLEFALGLNNTLGYAEDVSVSAELGMNNSTEFSVSVSKPRPGGLPVLLNMTGMKQRRSHQEASSFTDDTAGGAVSVASADGRHAVTAEVLVRKLSDASHHASPAVRQLLGEHLKPALAYTCRQSALDDAAYPTRGWAFRSTSELAGVWIDAKVVRYAKQHVRGQWVMPLVGDAVLSLEAEAGLMLPWGRGWSSKQTSIPDRFFLGGVNGNLRGFGFKGAGPMDYRRPDGQEDGRQRKDALGGDLFCALLAELRCRLPFKPLADAGVYGRAYANGGSNILLTGQAAPLQGPRATAAELARGLRWSVGVGLVWPTSIGKLELNVGRVLRSQPNDTLVGTPYGIQFGFASVT